MLRHYAEALRQSRLWFFRKGWKITRTVVGVFLALFLIVMVPTCLGCCFGFRCDFSHCHPPFPFDFRCPPGFLLSGTHPRLCCFGFRGEISAFHPFFPLVSPDSGTTLRCNCPSFPSFVLISPVFLSHLRLQVRLRPLPPSIFPWLSLISPVFLSHVRCTNDGAASTTTRT